MGRTELGESLYHGGPTAACCMFTRNSSTSGPSGSATMIYGAHPFSQQ